MKIPRFLHHLWATFAGYYWLPCPICGKYIGGHEYDGEKSGRLMSTASRGNVTCTDCKVEAERLNKLHGFSE